MESTNKVQQTLANLGIEALNTMQEQALQSIQTEQNTTLLAPTGSGKTLAFLLPIWHLLDPKKQGVQCLILSPTRELATQIERVWQKMSTGFKVNTCYGGHSMPTEVQNLSQPPALLIGTPGRISEHIARKTFGLDSIKILILDEFDKSLALGFQEQMAEIILVLKKLEKRVLVSATDKLSIPAFTGVTEPKVLNFNRTAEKSNDGLRLRTVVSPTEDKIDTLIRLLCELGHEATMIFCNLRETTEDTSATLKKMGIQSAFFHGGMEQIDREKALVRFRNGSTVFLVASDLAARGLDIPAVKNVIHYEIPLKNNDFLHRNGRTARMHADGTAYLVVYQNDPKPIYLDEMPELLTLSEKFELPTKSPWTTLYISGGKKDKISKMDIVGFLSKVGQLPKEDIGMIEIMDHMAFVAVKKTGISALITRLQGEKMKGKKYKINEAW